MPIFRLYHSYLNKRSIYHLVEKPALINIPLLKHLAVYRSLLIRSICLFSKAPLAQKGTFFCLLACLTGEFSCAHPVWPSCTAAGQPTPEGRPQDHGDTATHRPASRRTTPVWSSPKTGTCRSETLGMPHPETNTQHHVFRPNKEKCTHFCPKGNKYECR